MELHNLKMESKKISRPIKSFTSKLKKNVEIKIEKQILMQNKMNHPMLIALEQAKLAFDEGEVPVGAVITVSKTGKVIAKAHNQVRKLNDPTAHAEILAIRSASYSIGNSRLTGLNLFVTLEPCAMCAYAISLARLEKLVFGAYDLKNGGVEHGSRVFSNLACNHVPEIVGGVDETLARNLLKEFFHLKRR